MAKVFDGTWELSWFVGDEDREMQIIFNGGVVGTIKPGPGIVVFTDQELAERDAKIVTLALSKASDLIRARSSAHSGVVSTRFENGTAHAADLIDPRATDPG